MKRWELPTGWRMKHYNSIDDVPMHNKSLPAADREIRTVFNDREGVIYFHKPSTNQYWMQVGFVVDESGNRMCPTDECDAECCRSTTPWSSRFPMSDVKPCMFLENNRCGIQQAKFLCCATAPQPWNDMHLIPKCQLRCVEVTRDGSDSH